MKRTRLKFGRAMAVSALAGLLAAGCAGARGDSGEAAEAEREEDARRAADTVHYPGADPQGGTGVGGAGEPSPSDPTATDTAGIYGDPNAWPTGPLPGDTGVGGAGSPMPDTVWMDTASPADTFGFPEDEGPEGATGGGAGPDVW